MSSISFAVCSCVNSAGSSLIVLSLNPKEDYHRSTGILTSAGNIDDLFISDEFLPGERMNASRIGSALQPFTRPDTHIG